MNHGLLDPSKLGVNKGRKTTLPKQSILRVLVSYNTKIGVFLKWSSFKIAVPKKYLLNKEKVENKE